jgi:hypothetical protein
MVIQPGLLLRTVFLRVPTIPMMPMLTDQAFNWLVAHEDDEAGDEAKEKESEGVREASHQGSVKKGKHGKGGQANRKKGVVMDNINVDEAEEEALEAGCEVLHKKGKQVPISTLSPQKKKKNLALSSVLSALFIPHWKTLLHNPKIPFFCLQNHPLPSSAHHLAHPCYLVQNHSCHPLSQLPHSTLRILAHRLQKALTVPTL